MDDNRTMAQLLEAPTEGYEDANSNYHESPRITLRIKHGLLNLSKTSNFFGHDKEGPTCSHPYFNNIPSTMKIPGTSTDGSPILELSWCLKHQFHFHSRRNDEKAQGNSKQQIEKFYEIFRDFKFHRLALPDALDAHGA
ncbi:hypothetical protein Tco_0085724 [Tanacetum coccineum]